MLLQLLLCGLILHEACGIRRYGQHLVSLLPWSGSTVRPLWRSCADAGCGGCFRPVGAKGRPVCRERERQTDRLILRVCLEKMDALKKSGVSFWNQRREMGVQRQVRGEITEKICVKDLH